MKKNIQYKQNLALLFGCSAFMVFGLCSMIDNGGISIIGLMSAIKVAIPGTVVLYILGWMIGSIAEKSKINSAKASINSQLKDILDESTEDFDDDIDTSINLGEDSDDDEDISINNLSIETEEE